MLEFVAGAVIAGRYRLERLLGEGGMGVVWLATHQVTQKRVALKVLHDDQASDRKVRARFLREARAASAVQHPNIVEIHDVLELEDSTPVMVMEYLEGESLGTRLDREGAIRLSELAQILLPVCSAVGAAHAAGIVHRDLKPDNVFISKNSSGQAQVKVLDFGIAKLTAVDGASTATLTGTGAMLGTPYYMAPEQIFGERDIDFRADVWAIGVMIFECVTGKRPTEGENVGQIMKVITTGRIPKIETVSPNLPPDVCALVNRMLSVEREERPSDMQEISNTLARHVIDGQTLPPPVSSPRISMSDVEGRKKIVLAEDADEMSATVQSGELSAAATLNSTTTDPKRTTGSTSRSRTGYYIAAVLVLGLGAGAFYTTRNTEAPVTNPSNNPIKTAPAISTIEPVMATTSAPAASSATVVASASAKPTVSVATAKPRPSATQTATAAASASVNYGGVIDKPPF